MKIKSLKFWQWETLLVTMAGYAAYYIVRKNLSLALPLISDEFGISKVQLGAFLTAHGLIYGLARFTNGVLTDRNSARKVMSCGLFACAMINILFGCSDKIAQCLAKIASGGAVAQSTLWLVWTMGIIWVINGYFQGMGVGPCVKTIPRWFRKEELATKQSIWNLSHSIGAGAVFALLGWYVIPTFNAWRLCFIIPGLIALIGAIGIWFAMKDDPSEVGLAGELGDRSLPNGKTAEPATAAFIREHVLMNPYIWILAVANFFMNTIRFAALDWGPMLLVESKGLNLAAATSLCFTFEIVGGNLGMVVSGWLSDHVFASRTHRTCAVSFVGVAIASGCFWLTPASAPLIVKLLGFAAIGFFLYGPQALLGVASTQQATSKAAGSANGILGIAGYLSTVLSGVGFGFMADKWGWESVYLVMVIAALAGGFTVALMWKKGIEND